MTHSPTQSQSKVILVSIILTVVLGGFVRRADAQDLYIRDDVSDTGAEPNLTASPMWLSPDIWVRNNPLPGWNPRPYSISAPPAWVDATHFNPDYASPLSGKPNYIYVRVRNRSTATASSGTERLTFYWASASTGLSWDPAKAGGSFIDNVQGGVLFGAEATKVRKNAATATQGERDAYLAALKKIAVDPSFVFLAGMSYWRTQQQIHRFGPTYRHGFPTPAAWVPSVAFLPWHREFVNRYEALLQEADPKVKLLYWQWTQNPTDAAIFDYSVNFMGSFGTGNPAAAVPIGAPLSPELDAAYGKFSAGGPIAPTRRLQVNATPQSDATVLGRIPYDSSSPNANNAFSGGLESLSHNNAHVYIASATNNPNSNTIANALTAGDQLFQPYAARDPFFFFLHAKVDELWARWQRRSLDNLDPATTYGTAAGNVTITGPMGPWDGTAVPSDGLPNALPAAELEPWTAAGGQIYAKPANDRSVTSPPFYDTAPLTIPVLQPGQEVILEIPWFPPNPASFGTIADPQHVCLIARIETSTTSPFGMTTAETNDLNANTRNNNNIAWRNVSVVDSFPGPFRSTRFFLENGFLVPVQAGLRLGAELNRPAGEFFERGTVRVDLGRELFERWRAGGARAQGVEVISNEQLRIARAGATLEGIALKAGERFPVRMFFDLKKDYSPTKRGEHLIYDVVQTGTPDDPRATVGGQRLQIAVDKLTPLERGRVWRWTPGALRVPAKWTSVGFDDSGWFERKLDLGWVEAPGAKDHGASNATTFYFRKVFDVEDPGFFRDLVLSIKRSDGAVVYLNEREVYRTNLPDGAVNVRTLARAPVPRLEREAYVPVKVDPSLLRLGRNVIAVELHRAEANRGELTFDVGLNANTGGAQQPPQVQFANLFDGKLLTVGRVATIDVDAVKVDGTIRLVTLMVDDKPAGRLERPPFTFKWQVQPGTHRISVVVTDSDGLQSSTFAAVTGVKNVPPVVSLTQPAQHTEIAVGDALVAVAKAEDPDGKIARVDFFVHDSYVIGAAGRLVGSVRSAPYTVTLKDLKAGHAMVTAVAFDDGGERTASIPIMVIVTER